MTAPGMLFGKVVRPAAFGAKLQSFDASAAEKMPGVVVVHDGEFLGVAAPDPETAEKAAAAIRAKWKTEPQPSSDQLFEYLKSHTEGDSQRNYEAGSVDSALASAEVKLRQTYNVAYIAHAPLEPRAALAQWSDDGRVTVWTGTQRPFGVRTELTQAFHIPDEKVRVIMPDMGSGYGGKHTGEAALEAARLAKAAGKPVKVVWTREDEFTWAYFRPAGVIEVASGAKRDGTITAWDFHNYNSGASGIRGKYDIANERVAFHPTKSPLRQGSYRALAATANHFARESHMDELAHEVGMDPVQFRLHNLKDERQKAVLKAAADKFGWGKAKASEGHGFGIACGFDKNGYVATARRSFGGPQVRQGESGAGGDGLGFRRRGKPRWTEESGGRREHYGSGRRAVRGNPFRQRPHPEPSFRELPRSQVRRCSGHRDGADGSQRHHARRRRRNFHCRARARPSETRSLRRLACGCAICRWFRTACSRLRRQQMRGS